MSFSGMLFLTFLALIVFGPKKLPHIAKQIGRMLTELKSVTRSQLEIEMEAAGKQQETAPASLPPSKSPTETGPRVLESDAFGSEHGRVEAFHG